MGQHESLPVSGFGLPGSPSAGDSFSVAPARTVRALLQRQGHERRRGSREFHDPRAEADFPGLDPPSRSPSRAGSRHDGRERLGADVDVQRGQRKSVLRNRRDARSGHAHVLDHGEHSIARDAKLQGRSHVDQKSAQRHVAARRGCRRRRRPKRAILHRRRGRRAHRECSIRRELDQRRRRRQFSATRSQPCLSVPPVQGLHGRSESLERRHHGGEHLRASQNRAVCLARKL